MSQKEGQEDRAGKGVRGTSLVLTGSSGPPGLPFGSSVGSLWNLYPPKEMEGYVLVYASAFILLLICAGSAMKL